MKRRVGLSGESRVESREPSRAVAEVARLAAVLDSCRKSGDFRYDFIVVALVALLSCAAPPQARADQPSAPRAAIVGVRVGLGGAYKVGFWTPVEVRVENRGTASIVGRVALILPDGDGIPSRVTSPEPVEIAPGATAAVGLYAKFGRIESPLDARFVHEGEVLARRELQAGRGEAPFFVPAALPAIDELLVAIGPPLGAEALERLARRRHRVETHVVELTSIDALPTAWYGYEGVSAILFSTGAPGLYAGLSPQSPQAAAIDQWIRLGGLAVLSVGPRAEEVLAEGTFLAALAPGKFERMLPLRRSTALEIYADTKAPLEAEQRRFRLEVPQLAEVRGRIEVHEGARPTDLPLVIRAPRGFGEVVFAAVDLAEAPFPQWAGRTDFLARLLAWPLGERRGETSESLGAVTTIGYRDLSGQLRAALEQFGGVAVVSFGVVGGLLFAYLLLIGPFDYWLVKKVLRRAEATWITFSLLVVAISIAAYFAAHALKGRELRGNQVELVDVDLESGLARGTVWANLFSPEPAVYDLSLTTELPGKIAVEREPRVLLSWLGLPGAALGGMRADDGNSPLLRRPYDFSPELNTLSGVPVRIWSTKGFYARWQAQVQAPLRAELVATDDGMLEGRLVNRLGIDLIDARLHYGRWVYPIPTLKNGRGVAVGDRLQPLTSRTLLTRRRTVLGAEKEQLRDATTAYDPRATDVPRIMDMMMFHRLVGGANYTAGLTHRYQGFTDLSGHLKLGRAILVARGKTPTATLARDGEPLAGEHHEHWTFYRFVIPVAEEP